MKIVFAEEMKQIDERALKEYGLQSIILMENAGIRVVEVAENLLDNSARRRVVIVAGRGNNGGDGLVAARHLMNAGATVDVFLLGTPDEMTPDTKANYEILANMKASLFPLHDEAGLNDLMLSIMTCDLVIDALYGISFRGRLSDFDTKVVRIINWSHKPVIAVDIPSGVEADTGKVGGEAVRATWTVTLALPKLGLLLDPGYNYTGTLTVADISVPSRMLTSNDLTKNLITEDMLQGPFWVRAGESHKGTYGHVLVIGGSVGLTGAVILTSSAALLTGAGLVTAGVPGSLLPIIEGNLVEVMTAPLPETPEQAIGMEALPAIENLLGTASVCAIGPGMSRYPEAQAIIRYVLERSGVPVVIDADGLNALAEDVSILKNRQIPIILTPHPGEMARLMNTTVEDVQSRRLEIATSAAAEWGVTILLKGSRTIIAEPGGAVYINITGNPGMATAGSGDVLTGIIAGLISQGMRPNMAAYIGAYLHGKAGDVSKESNGERGTTAGALVNALPQVIKAYENL